MFINLIFYLRGFYFHDQVFVLPKSESENFQNELKVKISDYNFHIIGKFFYYYGKI